MTEGTGWGLTASARAETAPALPAAEARLIALWQEAHAADEGILYCLNRRSKHAFRPTQPYSHG